MPNYYYIDRNGQKQGPINAHQLQALTTRGIIATDTLLETDAGHQGTAGQIPGLKFPVQPTYSSSLQGPNNQPVHSSQIPNSQSAYDNTPESNTYSVAQVRYRSDTEATPIFELLFDHSFRELRPETIFLWIIKILYMAGLIAIILGSLFYCGSTIYFTFRSMQNLEGTAKIYAILLMLVTIPGVLVGCFLALCSLRLFCEWSIIITHYSLIWSIEIIKEIVKWLREISKLLKAARIYLEANWRR